MATAALLDGTGDGFEPERPLSGLTVAGQVGERIRAAILDGRLAPGTRLNQKQLAESYRVSMTPVREALGRLIAEGLLDEVPHNGITVHQPTLVEFEQVSDMRKALLPQAIEQAVAESSPERIARARRLIDQMDEPMSTTQWVDLNRTFHQCMYPLEGNRPLADVLNRLDGLASLYVHLSMDERDPNANDEHRQILDAFARGDADDAIQISIVHLEETRQAARDALERG